jgi:hypothetical protein
MQFQAYLAYPENRGLVTEDSGDLAGLFAEVGTVVGDINKLLLHQPELEIRAGWFHTKYSGFLATLSRECTTIYNLEYSDKRGHGYGEWDAKRMADTKKEFLQASERRDRLQVLVNILKLLVDACKSRLAALQQVANNYRAEIRELPL